MDNQEEPIFDDQIFKDHIRNKLMTLFSSIDTKMDLFLDYNTLSCLNLTIDKNTLKESGVQNWFILDSNTIESNYKSIVFFVAPDIQMMKRIANIIITHQQKKIDKDYHLIFWPRRTIICKEQLEIENVYSQINIKDFNFDLIPLENDLLSLEMDCFFKDFYLDNDLSLAQYVSESLDRFQTVFGQFTKVYAKGPAANIVIENLKNIQNQGIHYEDSKGELESLIILDRQIDFMTPLISQQTYKGRIDEYYQIQNNQIKINSQTINNTTEEKQVYFQLNKKQDIIFNELADLHFDLARKVLKQKAQFAEQVIKDKNQQNLQELGEHVKKFKEVNSIYGIMTKHINLSYAISQLEKDINYYKNQNTEIQIMIGIKPQEIIDDIEVQISLQEPLSKVLRLFCLLTLKDNDIKQKQIESIKKEILQTYGFQYILLLNNLEKIGIIRKLEQKSNFNQLEKNLTLTNFNMSIEDPDAQPFSYTGYYKPLITKLVEECLQNGWKNIFDSMRLIPGNTDIMENNNYNMKNKRSLIMIFVIGGITYAEIATIRSIGKKMNKEILICTTQIINGHKLITQCIEN